MLWPPWTLKSLKPTLEKPVKKAVIAMFPMTASSGFHHFHAPPAWGIVFKDIASKEVVEAAEECGLTVRYRSHVATRTTHTDIYLPDVPEDEPDRAQKVFDRFARIYKQKMRDRPDA